MIQHWGLEGSYLDSSYPKRFDHTTNTCFGGGKNHIFFPTTRWWNNHLHLFKMKLFFLPPCFRMHVSQNELSSKVERKRNQCHSFHLFKLLPWFNFRRFAKISLNANVQMISREGLTLQTERELFNSNCFVKNWHKQ